MSKGIWHITNQDKKTTDIPEEENFVVLVGAWVACIYFPEPILWENVKKWCYLDDLLNLEHENAQLAHKVDVALAGLKYIQQNCLEYAADYMDYADTLIEKIKDTK